MNKNSTPGSPLVFSNLGAMNEQELHLGEEDQREGRPPGSERGRRVIAAEEDEDGDREHGGGEELE
jgi:hypothetical protein